MSRRLNDDIRRELAALRNAGQPPLRVADAGGGAGGGSTATQAVVFQNFTGFAWAEDGQALVPDVACLPLTLASGNWRVDTAAEVINAKPAFGVTIDLASTSCGAALATVEAGLQIATPVAGDNRVDNGQNSLTITGTGVDPASTVNATFPSPVGVVACTVGADGTWTTGGVDISGLAAASDSERAKTVSIAETDLDSFTEKARLVTFTLTDGYTAANMAVIDSTPTAPPDLVTASDTGDDPGDNRTSDTTPTFKLRSTRDSDGTGPGWRLYADGVPIAGSSGTLSDIFDDNREALATPSTALANGTHRITYTLITDDGGTQVESGHSPALEVVIDPSIIAGEGDITATAEATADFSLADLTISLGSVTIVNRSSDPDPAAPSSVSQPSSPVEGLTGDKLELIYTGGAWSLHRPQRYGRGCVLQTTELGTILTAVSPCPRQNTIQENIVLMRAGVIL